MKFFKMNRVKRLVLLAVSLTAAILTIVFGSVFYVSKNDRKSIEYAGGVEYNVDISSSNAKEIVTDVADSIYQRVNGLGLKGIEVEPETNNIGASVRVVAPGLESSQDRRDFEKLITEKPQLVLTDFYGNPLFNENGNFRDELRGDPSGWALSIPMEEFYEYDPNAPNKLQTQVPISDGGARSELQQDGSRYVSVDLIPDKVNEWNLATRYISSLPESKRVVLAWLDPNKLIYNLKNFFSGLTSPTWSQLWSIYSNPTYGFASLARVVDLNSGKISASGWESVINSRDYLISTARVDEPLFGESFTITGNFSANDTNRLVRNINYGTSNYSLNIKYSNVVNPTFGSDAFNKAIIAGIIAFSLVALVLVLNYGLLGALSTISIALFVFITLAMFTVMRGEYSPAAIAALIIGIGMAVDSSIITFERLKGELYSGSSMKKSLNQSNKKSLSTIFDSNITTLIVAIVLFFFGTRSIIGLSITLILSIVFTLIVMLLFTRYTATLLINSGVFHDKKWLVGLNSKVDSKTQEKINKFDYIKNAKWFSIGSVLFALVGILVFSIFAGIGGSFKSGFVLSQEFAGGSAVTFAPLSGTLSIQDQNSIVNYLVQEYEIPQSSINISSEAISFKSLTPFTITDFANLQNDIGFQLDIQANTTSTVVARELVKDALTGILVAMGAIIIYTIIRFKWSYSIAAIFALIHDSLIVLFAFLIFRLEISPIFVAAVLSVVGYSINDTIVTFDRVREKMTTHLGDLNKNLIKDIANSAIKDTLKRSILTSLTTMIAIVVLMSFGNATAFSYNIAMLFGLTSGTYSSIFIATYIWTKLESFRQNRIKKREQKGFWKTEGTEEQTIPGINDFNV